MPETFSARIQREQRELNRARLESAQRGLNDLREATWQAHQTLGVVTEAEHFEIASAYSVIERVLDKLKARPEYKE